jgi:2-polyprenyl-3-methyl-5-hydroxy-6-metoxy-1,4-benzoquinol methylase
MISNFDNMPVVENDWTKHWKSISATHKNIWQINMSFFLKATEPLLSFCEQDIVLDIGCGLGYLADAIREQVKEIHCLDISEQFLDEAKKKFAQSNNIFFYQLAPDDYTDLTFLGSRRFSKVICQSVVQYYRDYFEVERLIANVRQVTSNGAKFLISDMPTDRCPLHNIISILEFCVRKKCLLEAFKHLHSLRFSNYQKVRSQMGVLVFTEDILNKIIENNNLEAEIISSQLTIDKRRLHLLIKF